MSKFLDAVEAKLHGSRRMAMWPMEPLSVTREVTTPASYTALQNYEIGVHWKVRLSCDPKDLQPALKNVMRELQEAVYGEFRSRIIRLERAILEHDEQKARSEVRDLLVEVSNV
jgi:hypothetical protein